MRKSWRVGLTIFLFACGAASAEDEPGSVGGSFGGGVRIDDARPHLSRTERLAIQEEVSRNVTRLRAEGSLPPQAESSTLFDWPLRPANGESGFGYHGLSPFVDHDSTAGIEDFACGPDSYDGHQGTDIINWPFAWLKVQQEKVEIVAAAAGTIVWRADGFFDMNCVWANQSANGVTLRHDDGTYAVYLHMKNGSVSTKTVGETVERGEYLGIVASSGISNWPHLHFEVWDENSDTIDPFQGGCNGTTNRSWWNDQRPHRDTGINLLTTGLAAPDALPACPQIEDPKIVKDFNPGQTVYLTAYYRDQRHFQPTVLQVLTPTGSVMWGWSHELTPPDAVYDVSYWYWFVTLPAGAASGTWTFRATFEGSTYEQQFNVGVASAGRIPPTLRIEKTPGIPTSGARLLWGDSCKSSDSDYAIYEGTLGSTFYNHGRKVCSTGGEKSWTFATVPTGDVYWLVVPGNANRGGSYGRDSDGVERPEAPLLSRCAQQFFACP